MIDERIVYTDENGGLWFIAPTESGLKELTMDEIAKRHVPAGLSYRITHKSNFPDDYFRNAWRDSNDKIDIDMDKARKIHMDKLRQLRQEKFEKLGFATKINPDLEALLPDAIKVQLQELRDIPQTYNLSIAEKPEELKAMIPEQLADVI